MCIHTHIYVYHIHGILTSITCFLRNTGSKEGGNSIRLGQKKEISWKVILVITRWFLVRLISRF